MSSNGRDFPPPTMTGMDPQRKDSTNRTRDEDCGKSLNKEREKMADLCPQERVMLSPHNHHSACVVWVGADSQSVETSAPGRLPFIEASKDVSG